MTGHRRDDGVAVARQPHMRFAPFAAVAGGIVGVLFWPLHSLAYLATKDGGDPVLNWADTGRDVFGPLLDWDSVDTVYKTYGKLWLIVVAGFLLGLIALRAAREGKGKPAGLERWGWRIALAGYSLLLLGVTVEYFTPWLDFGFVAFSGPGLLLGLIGSTLLGAGLLRGGPETRVGAWLLALSIPLLLAMTAVFGHLSAGLLPLDLAWIAIGLALLRGGAQSREASASTTADWSQVSQP